MTWRLALLALLASGCLDDIVPGTKPPCMETGEKSLSIPTPTDPQSQFQINMCMADREACTTFCTMLLAQQNINGTATSCDVRFGDTKIDVTVHYQYMRADAENCPFVPVDAGIFVPSGGK